MITLQRMSPRLANCGKARYWSTLESLEQQPLHRKYENRSRCKHYVELNLSFYSFSYAIQYFSDQWISIPYVKVFFCIIFMTKESCIPPTDSQLYNSNNINIQTFNLLPTKRTVNTVKPYNLTNSSLWLNIGLEYKVCLQ